MLEEQSACNSSPPQKTSNKNWK